MKKYYKIPSKFEAGNSSFIYPKRQQKHNEVRNRHDFHFTNDHASGGGKNVRRNIENLRYAFGKNYVYITPQIEKDGYIRGTDVTANKKKTPTNRLPSTRNVTTNEQQSSYGSNTFIFFIPPQKSWKNHG